MRECLPAMTLLLPDASHWRRSCRSLPLLRAIGGWRSRAACPAADDIGGGWIPTDYEPPLFPFHPSSFIPHPSTVWDRPATAQVLMQALASKQDELILALRR
jgi:hypothetical protein